MESQVVTIEELIQYLVEIVEAYGDIPAVVASRVDGLVESVGRPKVLSVPPACSVDGFQAYNYAAEEGGLHAEAPRTEVALIR